jgi:small subunit ribosomal protein S18
MSFYYRKKMPRIPKVNEADIDYKDINTLRMYVLESGRIIPSRITGVSHKKQRKLANAIKIARFLALLPYTDKHKK